MMKLCSMVASLGLLLALGASPPVHAADAPVVTKKKVVKRSKKAVVRHARPWRLCCRAVRPVHVYPRRYVRYRYARPFYVYYRPYWRYRYVRPYRYAYDRPYWRYGSYRPYRYGHYRPYYGYGRYRPYRYAYHRPYYRPYYRGHYRSWIW